MFEDVDIGFQIKDTKKKRLKHHPARTVIGSRTKDITNNHIYNSATTSGHATPQLRLAMRAPIENGVRSRGVDPRLKAMTIDVDYNQEWYVKL
jgi:hypothetical protein